MALHSVHLSFTANLSPTEPKALGCVERIMVDLLRLKNPNPHVKKLEVLFQIRSRQQQNMKVYIAFMVINLLLALHNIFNIFVLLHFLMRPSVLWKFVTGTLERKRNISFQCKFFLKSPWSSRSWSKTHFVPGCVVEASHICITVFI